MTSLRCYGDSHHDKIHRNQNFGLSPVLYCVLVRCDLYLKLLWLDYVTIGSFHVTQVSFIIMQVSRKVKIEIAYHSINWVKKWKYRRKEYWTNSVPGMCNIPNSSFPAKGITENYRADYLNEV